MSEFLQQVFSLLITHSGSLAYHLVLAFSILAALLAALSQGRSPVDLESAASNRRLVLGLSLLLVFRLVLFLTAGLYWQRLVSPDLVIPVLERTVDLISLLVITWLWAFPDPNWLSDLAVFALGSLIVGAALLGVASGFPIAIGQALNGSTLDGYTQAIGVGLALVGVLLLLLRQPAGWQMGVVMLTILGFGHFFQIWKPISGDYPGSVRLTQMMAYPLLIAIPFRKSILSVSTKTPPDGASFQEPGKGTTDGALFPSDALRMAWISVDDPLPAGVQLASRLAGEIQAEICLFLWAPDEQNTISGRFGYDLVHRLAIPDFQIDSQSLPVLTQTFLQKQAFFLPGNSTAPDLAELAKVLELKRSGALLAAPVQSADSQPFVLVLMLRPFSGRGWSAGELQRLAVLVYPLACILQRDQRMIEMQAELVQLRQALGSSQERVQKAENDRRTILDMVTIMQQSPGSDGLVVDHGENNVGQQIPVRNLSAPVNSGDTMRKDKHQSNSCGGGSRRE